MASNERLWKCPDCNREEERHPSKLKRPFCDGCEGRDAVLIEMEPVGPGSEKFFDEDGNSIHPTPVTDGGGLLGDGPESNDVVAEKAAELEASREDVTEGLAPIDPADIDPEELATATETTSDEAVAKGWGRLEDAEQTNPETALTDAIGIHYDDEQCGAPTGKVVEEMLSKPSIDVGDVGEVLRELYFAGEIYQPSSTTLARVSTDGGEALGHQGEDEPKQMGRPQAAFITLVFAVISGAAFYVGYTLLGGAAAFGAGYLAFLAMNYPYINYVVTGRQP